jgi:hypothetical protein
VLASELNHVEKAIQTRAGILICATYEMKSAGGFDGAPLLVMPLTVSIINETFLYKIK